MAKIFLTTWCGGSPGNSECDYNCKLCLILSGQAELIKADDKSLKLTYRIKTASSPSTPKSEAREQ